MGPPATNGTWYRTRIIYTVLYIWTVCATPILYIGPSATWSSDYLRNHERCCLHEVSTVILQTLLTRVASAFIYSSVIYEQLQASKILPLYIFAAQAAACGWIVRQPVMLPDHNTPSSAWISRGKLKCPFPIDVESQCGSCVERTTSARRKMKPQHTIRRMTPTRPPFDLNGRIAGREKSRSKGVRRSSAKLLFQRSSTWFYPRMKSAPALQRSYVVHNACGTMCVIEPHFCIIEWVHLVVVFVFDFWSHELTQIC